MALRVATGTYTGDGSSDRHITGLGFSPKIVFVAHNANGLRWVKFSSIDGTYADRAFTSCDNTDLTSSNNGNFIDSCDADGFTITYNAVYGEDNATNKNGGTYYWWAAGGDATEIVAGKYTGNGSDNRGITGVGFQPGFVWIIGTSNEHSVWKTTSTGASTDNSCFSNYDFASNMIQSLDADGFTVGTSNRVNANAGTFWYIAIKDITGQFKSGTYSGNGSDNRDITGVGFQSKVVWIAGDPSSGSSSYSAFRIDTMPAGDNSMVYRLGAVSTNMVQSIGADGFQVGTATHVNSNSITYYWLAFKDAAASGPANVKTVNGLAKASVKTVNGLAMASIKTINGLN